MNYPSQRLYHVWDSHNAPACLSHRIISFCVRCQDGKIFVKDLENRSLLNMWILWRESFVSSPEVEGVNQCVSLNTALNSAESLAAGKVRLCRPNSSSTTFRPGPLMMKTWTLLTSQGARGCSQLLESLCFTAGSLDGTSSAFGKTQARVTGRQMLEWIPVYIHNSWPHKNQFLMHN